MSGGEAGIRIGMQNAGLRNPPIEDWGETIPSHLCALTATDQDASAFRSSIARPTDTSVYASNTISRCRLQDSRPGWIRCFLSCRALSSPTTYRFIPALSGLPTIRELARIVKIARNAIFDPRKGGCGPRWKPGRRKRKLSGNFLETISSVAP
jgi:hypothetical protein